MSRRKPEVGKCSSARWSQCRSSIEDFGCYSGYGRPVALPGDLNTPGLLQHPNKAAHHSTSHVCADAPRECSGNFPVLQPASTLHTSLSISLTVLVDIYQPRICELVKVINTLLTQRIGAVLLPLGVEAIRHPTMRPSHFQHSGIAVH